MRINQDILKLTPEQVCHYEIARAWWPEYVSWHWAQELAGSYFAWKTRRVLRRFRGHDERQKWIAKVQRSLLAEGYRGDEACDCAHKLAEIMDWQRVAPIDALNAAKRQAGG